MLPSLPSSTKHLACSAQALFSRLLRSPQPQWKRNVTDYRAKYAGQLEKIAQQRGSSVEELRARLLEQQREQERQRAVEAEARHARERVPEKNGVQAPAHEIQSPPGLFVRRDSSPIKPLSELLNTERLLSKPHTAEQVSALWTTFHASRSGGTGVGYICASLPRKIYDSLLSVAQRYSKFVLPIPRPRTMTSSDVNDDHSETNAAYEFYVLEWNFYHAPPTPPASFDPLSLQSSHKGDMRTTNPRLATVIFTPLLEYKLRQTFATPYLVLTFYSDLASSHGLVLMRGEITPSAAKELATGDYLLSQHDAQLLAHGLQRFYLWGSNEEREKLLSDFHERPDTFKWEELLKHGDFGV